ncbi:MAG: hypothetical protein F6K28_26420 [Microcoleus sp. SIO2G3]|nr:hypothetical protein [Microcoleus sp. SIO2G3]
MENAFQAALGNSYATYKWSNDWERIQKLQKLGLWVIAQKITLYCGVTDATIGQDWHLVEAHTDEGAAQARSLYHRTENIGNPDVQTVLLEPCVTVWGKLDIFSDVKALETFDKRKDAESYASKVTEAYCALWILTANELAPERHDVQSSVDKGDRYRQIKDAYEQAKSDGDIPL